MLAIAFIAFFGVVTVAVFRFADATGLQHVHTEMTASNDSLAEGGAAWAAADAASSSYTCTSGGSGSLTMQGGDVAGYQVNPNGCNPGETGSGGGHPPGYYCEICLLASITTCSSSSAALMLSGGSTISIAGEIDSNGSIYTSESSSTVTAGKISLVTGIPYCEGKNKIVSGSCWCTPTPGYPFGGPIADPFAGTLPTPTPSGSPHTVTYSKSTPTLTLNPGIYSQISVTGPGVVSLNAGTYILTGPLTLTNSASVTANGSVVLYLACPAAAAPWVKACPTGGSGGAISVTGNAALTMTAGSGSYAGVSVFADPKLSDPTGGDVIVLGNSGKVDSFSGAVDVPSGSVIDTGDSAFDVAGRLVAADLVNGGSGAMNFTGSFPISPSCPVTDDSVSGTLGTPPHSTGSGRAIVQSGCNGHNGIVDFNYLP